MNDVTFHVFLFVWCGFYAWFWPLAFNVYRETHTSPCGKTFSYLCFAQHLNKYTENNYFENAKVTTDLVYEGCGVLLMGPTVSLFVWLKPRFDSGEIWNDPVSLILFGFAPTYLFGIVSWFCNPIFFAYRSYMFRYGGGVQVPVQKEEKRGEVDEEKCQA